MGVEVQIRPAASEVVHVQIARGEGSALFSRRSRGGRGRQEDPWDSSDKMAQLVWVDAIRAVYHAGIDVPGIHAPEPEFSNLVETEGADDDGTLDTPAAEPSP